MERYELLVQVAGYENTTGIILTSHRYTYGASYSIGDILQINGGLIDAFVRVDSLRPDPSGFSINIISVNVPFGYITSSSLNTGGSGYIAGDIFIVNGGSSHAIGVVDAVGGSGNVLTYHLTSNGGDYVIGPETTVLSPLSSKGVLTYTILFGGYGYTIGSIYSSLDTTGSGSGFSLIVDSLEYSNTQALDTFGDNTQVSIPLNYNIADINDITSKNSSYSKSISIPDTKVNRQVFRYIFDLNADSLFDPTKKSKCWVLKDTVIQFEGNLQMVGITYDRKTFKDTYECVIYADNDTLFTNIGEKYLNELDLSYINHTLTVDNIVNSWSGDYTTGYYYPLIDYTGAMTYRAVSRGYLTILNFLPSIYIKSIVDQIFVDAGFSYTSDFFNSYFFKQLILPFIDAPILTPSITGLTFSDNTIAQFGITPSTVPSNYTPVSSDTINETWLGWGSFNCNNDIFDPNNFYSTSTLEYIHNTPEQFVEYFEIDLDIVINTGTFSSATKPWTQAIDDVYIMVRRDMFPDGSSVAGWVNNPSLTQLTSVDTTSAVPNGAGYYPEISFNNLSCYYIRQAIENNKLTLTSIDDYNYRITGKITTDELILNPLREGETVRFFFMRGPFVTPGVSPPYPYTGTIYLKSGTIVTAKYNPNRLSSGSNISVANLLSSNIKQKDFLNSIMKIFNLYLVPDKNKSNNFIIEPRNEYYSKYQVVKDWTQKLDFNQPIKSDVLSNTQVRKNIFTYKLDKDFYNTFFNTQTKQIYGQYEWDIDNDFIKDTKTLDTIFASTPIDILLSSSEIYLPHIVNNNNGNYQPFNGMIPRLLYKNKQSLTTDSFIFYGITYSYYPYAGPIDNPNTPSVSLNFGYMPSFYTNYIETTNNVFFNYWQDTMVELSNKNGRIITAYFNLNSVDISQFNFSDLIFFRVDGSEGYYRVNKIIDYDPSQNASTQVELITAQNYNIT